MITMITCLMIKTVISSITGNDIYRTMTYKKELEGKLFVKNATKTYSQPVSAALNGIFGKYSNNVTDEIYTSSKNIEIFNDIICIETNNFLVIDKIKYEEGEFAIASSRNNAFTLSSKDLSVFSNRFYKEKDNTLIFCTLQQTESLSASNTKGVYPKIYQFDLTSNTSKTLFPKTTDLTTLSSVFSLSSVFTGNFNINIVDGGLKNCQEIEFELDETGDRIKVIYGTGATKPTGATRNKYSHIFQ